MADKMAKLKTEWEAADQAGDTKRRREVSKAIAKIEPNARRVQIEVRETGPLETDN